MLIQIIKGSYGHQPVLPNGQKSPYVIRVTPDSPPIEVDDPTGEALVAQGAARKVEDEQSAIPETKPAEGAKETVSGDAKKGKAKKSAEQTGEVTE